MSQTLFQLAFLVAVPFWALMILTPTWRWSHRIVSSPLIVLPTLVVWAFAIAPAFGDFAREMLNPDLAGVRALLSRDEVVAAVWAQVIAWDLFIGRFVYLDSRRRGLHPLLMAPVLVLTILLSPIGFPLYLALRQLKPLPHASSSAEPASTPLPADTH
ncbi:ABA4-like family protein [Dactylosporangium sp. CA-139066]|uniref:ABA4-like family protein n=1 Tax=Dactylosporangium sp. CA-139066 TaxID=3239930 RepID=UPI003D8DF7CA